MFLLNAFQMHASWSIPSGYFFFKKADDTQFFIFFSVDLLWNDLWHCRMSTLWHFKFQIIKRLFFCISENWFRVKIFFKNSTWFFIYTYLFFSSIVYICTKKKQFLCTYIYISVYVCFVCIWYVFLCKRMSICMCTCVFV